MLNEHDFYLKKGNKEMFAIALDPYPRHMIESRVFRLFRKLLEVGQAVHFVRLLSNWYSIFTTDET